MTKFTAGIVLGVAVGLAGAAAVAVWALRDPLPRLAAEDIAAARQRWRDRGADDYEMLLEMSGDQAGTYRIQVHGGRVVRLVRDGKELSQRGEEWRFWTVEGLFEIIEMDLAERARADAAESAPALLLSAEFDSHDGRPIRYRRISSGDARRQSEWRIVEFNE